MSLQLVPIDFKTAAAFVEMWHRHHSAPIGHKFSVGVARGDLLVGVCIVGRPVSRHLDNGQTLEITRTATDGTRNANSMLYGAAARAAFALGYRTVITYNEDDESGASLRAAGYRVIASRPARSGWSVPSRPRDDTSYRSIPRNLWESVAEGVDA